jgi:hypothetical protein
MMKGNDDDDWSDISIPSVHTETTNDQVLDSPSLQAKPGVQYEGLQTSRKIAQWFPSRTTYSGIPIRFLDSIGIDAVGLKSPLSDAEIVMMGEPMIQEVAETQKTFSQCKSPLAGNLDSLTPILFLK